VCGLDWMSKSRSPVSQRIDPFLHWLVGVRFQEPRISNLSGHAYHWFLREWAIVRRVELARMTASFRSVAEHERSQFET